jgi:8-oxo-dGTP diphosphatase
VKRPLIGVGVVVFNEQEEILLIKRGKEPHFGRWMVPGGTLEWGETLEQAAIREVREETGIEIVIEAFVEVIEAISSGEPGFHYVIMDYAGRAVSGSLAAASDALDAVWAADGSLSEYDLTPELVGVIEKAKKATNRVA